MRRATAAEVGPGAVEGGTAATWTCRATTYRNEIPSASCAQRPSASAEGERLARPTGPSRGAIGGEDSRVDVVVANLVNDVQLKLWVDPEWLGEGGPRQTQPVHRSMTNPSPRWGRWVGSPWHHRHGVPGSCPRSARRQLQAPTTGSTRLSISTTPAGTRPISGLLERGWPAPLPREVKAMSKLDNETVRLLLLVVILLSIL